MLIKSNLSRSMESAQEFYSQSVSQFNGFENAGSLNEFHSMCFIVVNKKKVKMFDSLETSSHPQFITLID